jgi:multicomponent Na+:H+ antiporter subunit D
MLAIVIPLFIAAITPLVNRVSEKARDVIVVIGTMLTVVVLALMTSNVFVGGESMVYMMGGWSPPLGIILVVDSLSLFIALIISFLTFFAVIYSLGHMKEYDGLYQYYALIMLMLAGMNGIVLTGDMFNLFVFLEIMVIASYALVAFTIGKEQSEAAFKYQVISTLGTLGVLLGIGFLYAVTGTLNMADMASKINTLGTTNLILFFGLLLFIFGFGMKSAMVPMHWWLPDAYPAAPAPIAALLSGAAAKAGVYALARTLFIIYGGNGMAHFGLLIVLILGIVTMVVGGIMALVQVDVKRMLAYSSMGQMGYILFGLGIATSLGLTGAMFHMLNHAVAKALLFLCVGVIVYQLGMRRMDKLGGLGKKMPITAACFLIGSLAIAGIPPFNGFWSKLLLYISGFEAGSIYAVGSIIAIIMSVVTLGYLLNAFQKIFLGKLPEEIDPPKDTSITMMLPIIVLAILCLVIGLFPDVFIHLSELAANVLISPGAQQSYIDSVELWRPIP